MYKKTNCEELTNVNSSQLCEMSISNQNPILEVKRQRTWHLGGGCGGAVSTLQSQVLIVEGRVR